MSEDFAPPGLYAPSTLPPAFAAAQAVVVLRLATAGYATSPTDDPPDTAYAPRLLGDIEVGQSGADAIAIGGRIATTVGEASAWDADRQLAHLVAPGTADGRAVTIRVLEVTSAQPTNFGVALGSARVAFTGQVRRVDNTAGQYATIAMGDAAERLAVPLQPNRFAGSGGAEGNATVAGRPKPVAVGEVWNITPVYIGEHDLGDGDLPTYAVHWRGVQDIPAVRIRGVEQTSVAGPPGVGEFTAWAADGLFQLGSSPDGPVTADVEGDDGDTGYVSSTAGVIRRLLTSLVGYDDAEIDDQAWDIADTDLTGTVGWYRAADEISAAAAVDEILAGPAAVLCGGRDGRLRLWDPFAAGTTQWDLPAAHILALEPLPLPATLRPLPSTVAVAWGRNFTPMTDIAGSVPDALRTRLAAPLSGPTRASSTSIGTAVRQARDLVLPGLYVSEADAEARADQVLGLLAASPRMFRVTTDRYRGQIEAGDVGRITYPAFGLDGGATGVVLGWREGLAAARLQLDVLTSPYIVVGSSGIDADFVAPVESGLLGWWYLGDTVADTQHDRAGLADATLVGSPAITQGFVSFNGYASGQWLQTNVAETAAFTILVVARSSDTFAANSTRPMFTSNYGADAGNGGSLLGAGIYISAGTPPGGTVRLHGGQNNGGTLQVEISSTFAVTDVQAWNFYAGRMESVGTNPAVADNPRKLYDKTTAQTGTSNAYPRVVHSINKMRIGAAGNSTFGGKCDVAFAAYYNRALADAEVTDIYDAVAARLLSRYGIVI